MPNRDARCIRRKILVGYKISGLVWDGGLRPSVLNFNANPRPSIWTLCKHRIYSRGNLTRGGQTFTARHLLYHHCLPVQEGHEAFRIGFSLANKSLKSLTWKTYFWCPLAICSSSPLLIPWPTPTAITLTFFAWKESHVCIKCLLFVYRGLLIISVERRRQQRCQHQSFYEANCWRVNQLCSWSTRRNKFVLNGLICSSYLEVFSLNIYHFLFVVYLSENMERRPIAHKNGPIRLWMGCAQASQNAIYQPCM